MDPGHSTASGQGVAEVHTASGQGLAEGVASGQGAADAADDVDGADDADDVSTVGAASTVSVGSSWRRMVEGWDTDTEIETDIDERRDTETEPVFRIQMWMHPLFPDFTLMIARRLH